MVDITYRKPESKLCGKSLGSMKQGLRAHYKPKKLPELEAAVEHYWQTKRTKRVCERYVSQISRVFKKNTFLSHTYKINHQITVRHNLYSVVIRSSIKNKSINNIHEHRYCKYGL